MNRRERKSGRVHVSIADETTDMAASSPSRSAGLQLRTALLRTSVGVNGAAEAPRCCLTACMHRNVRSPAVAARSIFRTQELGH